MMGMTVARWKALRPKLTRENDAIVDVWNFCGGWDPDRVPIACAYYGLTDMHFIVTMLIAMRDRISEHRRAQAGG